MHGVMLHRQGHNVHIMEQGSDKPNSHMTGIGVAIDVLRFLEKFDRIDRPLGVPSDCWHLHDGNGKVDLFLKADRLLTSWDVLYYRLRANFDGLETGYCSRPEELKNSELGRAKYETGARVSDVIVENRKVTVHAEKTKTKEDFVLTVDMLIGADGSNSIVRRRFLPDGVITPRYSGYVAWRGVVPESDVSESTRKVFLRNVNFTILPTREHVIMCVCSHDKMAFWLILA